MPKKKTKDEFIEEAIKVHGNRYDYSKVKYKNASCKVIIICKIHGEFEQKPSNHIHRKSNCPLCVARNIKYSINTIDNSLNSYKSSI